MTSIVHAFRDAGRLFADLGRFVWQRKAWWLVPVLLVLAVLLLLVVLGETPLSPFIYSLF